MTPATRSDTLRHDTLITMPSKGRPRRSVRVEDSLWEEFEASAAAVDRDRAGLLRDFIRWHTGQPGAELPPRPQPKSSA